LTETAERKEWFSADGVYRELVEQPRRFLSPVVPRP
jgi:hypothetical protein